MNCVVTELKTGTAPVHASVSRPGGRVDARSLRIALTCGIVAVATKAPSVPAKVKPEILQVTMQRDPVNVGLRPSFVPVKTTVSEWEYGFRNITLTADKRIGVEISRKNDVKVSAKAPSVPFEFLEVCPISYVRSCFGAGYWRNDMAWMNDDAWDNGL